MLALPDRKPYYTPAEIAALAQVDPKTVMTWIHSGKVGAVQLSARIYRIPLAAAIKLLAPDDVRHPRIERRSVARIARPTDAAIRRRRRATRV